MRAKFAGVCWAMVAACAVGAPPAEVVSTWPEAGAIDVEPYVDVAAFLAGEIDPASVGDGVFGLIAGVRPVAGTASYDADAGAARFAPAAPLAAGLHQATLAGVLDDDGVEVVPHSWTFAVRERAWTRPAVRLGAGRGPRVAFDSAGQATAVFSGGAGGRFDVARDHWQVTGTTGIGRTVVETEPQVAGDLVGHAFAVWCERNGPEARVTVARFDAQTGWGEPIDVGPGDEPRVAATSVGAVIVWRRHLAGDRPELWAMRHRPGAGWDAPARVDSPEGMTPGRARVAVGAQGDAIVVWQQRDGDRSWVWANRQPLGGAWEGALRLKGELGGEAGTPAVAVDPDGGALVVWTQVDAEKHMVVASRYVVGVGWKPPTMIASSPYASAFPVIATDRRGGGVAAWIREDLSVWAVHHVVGKGWDLPELLGRDGIPGRVEVGVDGTGKAFAVWDDQYAANSVLRARRYVAGEGWTPSVVLHGVGLCLQPATAAREPVSCRGFPAQRPSLAVHPDGSAVVVWEQANGIVATSFR